MEEFCKKIYRRKWEEFNQFEKRSKERNKQLLLQLAQFDQINCEMADKTQGLKHEREQLFAAIKNRRRYTAHTETKEISLKWKSPIHSWPTKRINKLSATVPSNLQYLSQTSNLNTNNKPPIHPDTFLRKLQQTHSTVIQSQNKPPVMKFNVDEKKDVKPKVVQTRKTDNTKYEAKCPLSNEIVTLQNDDNNVINIEKVETVSVEENEQDNNDERIEELTSSKENEAANSTENGNDSSLQNPFINEEDNFQPDEIQETVNNYAPEELVSTDVYKEIQINNLIDKNIENNIGLLTKQNATMDQKLPTEQLLATKETANFVPIVNAENKDVITDDVLAYETKSKLNISSFLPSDDDDDEDSFLEIPKNTVNIFFEKTETNPFALSSSEKVGVDEDDSDDEAEDILNPFRNRLITLNKTNDEETSKEETTSPLQLQQKLESYLGTNTSKQQSKSVEPLKVNDDDFDFFD